MRVEDSKDCTEKRMRCGHVRLLGDKLLLVSEWTGERGSSSVTYGVGVSDMAKG